MNECAVFPVCGEIKREEVEKNLFPLFPKSKKSGLRPEGISENHFWMLIEISPLHSKKVILALRDFLVTGGSRKEVCMRHDVSQGYFSVALSKVSYVHNMVSVLAPYYVGDNAE